MSCRSAQKCIRQAAPQFLHLPADIRPRIKSRKQNSSHFYSRIAILLNAGDGLVELGDPGGRKNSRRCRNQNIGGTGKSVHRQHAQGRRCVNHDKIIVTGHRRHSLLQPVFLSGLGEFLLGSGQHNISRYNVIAALRVLDGVLDAGRPLHNLINRLDIIVLCSAGRREISLRIKVNPQNPVPLRCQSCSQCLGRGCFADTALLICYCTIDTFLIAVPFFGSFLLSFLRDLYFSVGCKKQLSFLYLLYEEVLS